LLLFLQINLILMFNATDISFEQEGQENNNFESELISKKESLEWVRLERLRINEIFKLF
jgi:hypothetical protein